jgi:hypothetical protein
MTAYLTKRDALRTIVRDGIESVLLSEGFEASGNLNWVRDVGELKHVIALLSRRDWFDVQWGVVSPAVTSILWGPQIQDSSDIRYSAISGTPGTIRHPPACQSFELSNENDEKRIKDVTLAISNDIRVVEERLRVFITRRGLRDYLLENKSLKDRRDFIIPSGLPLKLLTAAALAVADDDWDAEALAAEAEYLFSRYDDPLVVERISRLRSAIGDAHF